MAEPPFEVGAVQLTTEEAFALEVADTLVGAPGAPAGITAEEAEDSVPDPARFLAITVKV